MSFIPAWTVCARQCRAVLFMLSPASIRRVSPHQAKAWQHAGAGGGCACGCAALHTAEPCGHAADSHPAPQRAAGPILADGGQRGGASGGASCRAARSRCHSAAGRAEPRPCRVNASRWEEAVCPVDGSSARHLSLAGICYVTILQLAPFAESPKHQAAQPFSRPRSDASRCSNTRLRNALPAVPLQYQKLHIICIGQSKYCAAECGWSSRQDFRAAWDRIGPDL